MTLHLRGNIWHYDFWRGGERNWGSTGTRNKAKAKAFQAEEIRKAEEKMRRRKVAAAGAALAVENPRPTVAEMADSLSDARIGTRRDVHFRKNLRHIVAALGPDRPVDEISDRDVARVLRSEQVKWLLFGGQRLRLPGDVERYLPADLAPPDGERLSNARLSEILDELTEQMAEAEKPRYPLGTASVTINIIGAINGILTHARDAHGASIKKLESLSTKGLPSYARTRLLTFEEELGLRPCLDQLLRQVVDFAILSLLRISNIVSLRWSQVDLALRRIKVRIKRGKSFTGGISDRMATILVALPRVGEYVFMRPDPIDRSRFVPLTDDWVRRRFSEACSAAGISELTFRDLRRTGATRLYEATGKIDVVRRALGHKDEKTTWIYIGETPGDDEQADLMREIQDDAAEAFASHPGASLLVSARDRLLCVEVAIALTAAPLEALRRMALAAPELAAPLETLARYRSQAPAPVIDGFAQPYETKALGHGH